MASVAAFTTRGDYASGIPDFFRNMRLSLHGMNGEILFSEIESQQMIQVLSEINRLIELHRDRIEIVLNVNNQGTYDGTALKQIRLLRFLLFIYSLNRQNPENFSEMFWHSEDNFASVYRFVNQSEEVTTDYPGLFEHFPWSSAKGPFTTPMHLVYSGLASRGRTFLDALTYQFGLETTFGFLLTTTKELPQIES